MHPRLRIFKAYKSFALVLCSYWWLSLQRKVLGEAWAQEKIVKLHRKNARRIESTILELKGLFIKVGQMLSIMSNFLPQELTQGLEALQDSVPPHPYESIEKRFLEEFQKTPKEIFARFEERPLASASLGQVHEAYLNDGTKVAVKVQYPEIDEIIRQDVKILKRIFGVLHLFFPAYGLKGVYQEIAEVVLRELDYLFEAQNLEALTKNFADESQVDFPKVYWEYSCSKILTLEFMDGVKISAVEELKKQGVDPKELAARIIHVFCKQIFIDGIYHADPHPGNVLVHDNKIVLIDFGATATVSERMRHGITLFAEGLMKRDTKILSSALREMGFVARQDSFEPLERLVEYFYERLSNLKIENFRKLDISQIANFKNIDEIIELSKIKISFRDLLTSFHVPKDWILLERTMLLIMGLCSVLDPSLNPIEIVLPYVEKFVLKNKTFKDFVVDLSKQLVISYLQLPHEIQKTMRKLNEGSLSIRVPELRDHARKIYVLGHQAIYGILCLAGLGFASLWTSTRFESYSPYALYGSAFFGLVFVVSLLRNRS